MYLDSAGSETSEKKSLNIAVLIPCLNEEATIEKTIHAFQKELPEASIYVYDNASDDKTASIAQQAGAIVRLSPKRGKGNVVRQMFEEVEADIYIMIDGDNTYPSEDVHALLEPVIKEQADMVVGNRLTYADPENLTRLHHLGNRMLLGLLNFLFRSHFQDMLSGYRVMNREFVKNIPLLAEEFEVETEMTIQALEKRYAVVEQPIHYRSRPDGSKSKLRTFRDGYKILFTILWILRDYRPMTFFSIFASVLFLFGFVAGYNVIIEYIQTGAILQIPTAVLSVGLILIGVFTFLTGFSISTINRRFSELDTVLRKRHFKN